MPVDDSPRVDVVNGDVDIGDTVPRGIKDAIAVRRAGGPDIALEGDGYPLAVEYGPVELKKSALR